MTFNLPKKVNKLHLNGILGLVVLFVIVLLIDIVYADVVYADEPIKVTISGTLDNVQFDGGWTFTSEWKHSSYDNFLFDDDSRFVLRTAHQDGFFYVMINYLTDFTYNHIADNAIVCFDGYYTSNIADETDWCYAVSSESGNGHTLQGGSPIFQTSHFNLVKNHPDFVAYGGMAGKKDPYVWAPHATYEFRIPIEQIGFQDEYGFFIQIFDGNDVKTYPKEFSGKYPQKIPSPTKWGKIFSPDRSISE